MDDCVIDGSTAADAVSGINKTESPVSFQKFVYELFEKNGILNDLRAYLRGHIIDVLQNAQTGESPSCQKHFTQRLELTYQALNMLVAEYLLRLEFSYSLSVFVSEIPLANMVISFAKKLLLINNGNFESLKFKENDVWSILNYLGVKCDSAHASNIIKIYNSKNNVPLLLCILQCLPMYQKDISDQENLSSPSLSSSIKSLDNLEMSNNNCTTTKVPSGQEKCRHYAFCQTCQGKMEMVRQKYKDKKYNLTKELKLSDYNVLNIEMFMRNIGTMEKSLIDEMFQQLKSVYEAEVEMTKLHEQKKIKRSLANHALQLQKRRNEMEESFRTREAELERNVQEKKKFLWGLARALRDQHSQMARAMHAIRCETERLSAKEKNLNTQLLEAEEILRKRGEDMRKQISDELIVLEGHLESMKRERNSIKKERTELESLKAACKNSSVIQVDDSRKDELVSHYDVLKDELAILKKYLETTKLEPKRVIEKSTITDLNDVTAKVSVLNNEQQAERSALRNDSDDRIRTTNKVVNDWKKQKNVNFCTLKVDELYREHSRSSVSSDAIDVSVHTTGSRDLDRLRDENERLKTFARQQREHIDELTSHQAQLRAQLTVARFSNDGGNLSRPRTAPSHPAAPTLHRMNLSASSYAVGWRKGGGEEINTYWRAQPQVVLPGDAVPFIGPLRGRRADSRRYLINQWRGLRRRTSPPGGVGKLRAPACSKRDSAMSGLSEAAGPSVSSYATVTPIRDEATRQMNETFIFQNIPRERPKTSVTAHSQHPRDKSPKSVLREAKEKLRNHPRSTAPGRDKSPGAVLREAKLRLRKLEIEAEAVERSYMDFRRRHSADRQARDSVRGQLELGQFDVKSLSHHITQESYYRAKKITMPLFKSLRISS